MILKHIKPSEIKMDIKKQELKKAKIKSIFHEV